MKNDLESMDLFIQIKARLRSGQSCLFRHPCNYSYLDFFFSKFSFEVHPSTYIFKVITKCLQEMSVQCRKIVCKTQLCLYFDEKLAYFLLVQNEAEGFLNLHLCLKHHFSLEINQTKQSFWFFGQNIGLKSIVLRNIIFSSECKK